MCPAPQLPILGRDGTDTGPKTGDCVAISSVDFYEAADAHATTIGDGNNTGTSSSINIGGRRMEGSSGGARQGRVSCNVSIMEVADEGTSSVRLRGVASIDISGSCYALERIGQYLVLGSDEEISVLKVMQPGDSRAGMLCVGKGGIGVVSKSLTPSRCAVTCLSACKGTGDGEFFVAVAELLHSISVYEFSRSHGSSSNSHPDGSLQLICMKNDCGALLTTSICFLSPEFYNESNQVTLACADQSNDKLIFWALEETETGIVKESRDRASNENQSAALGNLSSDNGSRLPEVFFPKNAPDVTRSIRFDLKELGAWESPFESQGSNIACIVNAGLDGVLALSTSGGIAHASLPMDGEGLNLGR